MEDLKQRLVRLLGSQEWSVEDCQWMLDYLESNDSLALQQLMQQQFNGDLTRADLKDEKAQELLDLIHQRIRVQPVLLRKRTFYSKRLAIAAILILLVASAAFLFNWNRKEKLELVQAAPEKIMVAPGGNKAMLVLGDGHSIILDSAQNGMLTIQGRSKVVKKENGELSYSKNGGEDPSLIYNTLSTPRGGQYHIILADGTGVWLNAASSLRFPASFKGKERKVELTGEAYFEVTKDASAPFKVQLNSGKGEGSMVEVLGTHFNINAYADETSSTATLLEGKVKISAGQRSAFLTTGQQAAVAFNEEISINKEADLEEIMAWKNGYFSFTRLDMQSILRQVSRWYNVDVVYEGKMNHDHFSGIVSRNKNISEVLKIFEQSGIRFRTGETVPGKPVKIIVIQN